LFARPKIGAAAAKQNTKGKTPSKQIVKKAPFQKAKKPAKEVAKKALFQKAKKPAKEVAKKKPFERAKKPSKQIVKKKPVQKAKKPSKQIVKKKPFKGGKATSEKVVKKKRRRRRSPDGLIQSLVGQIIVIGAVGGATLAAAAVLGYGSINPASSIGKISGKAPATTTKVVGKNVIGNRKGKTTKSPIGYDLDVGVLPASTAAKETKVEPVEETKPEAAAPAAASESK